jgi:hypothetical protein
MWHIVWCMLIGKLVEQRVGVPGGRCQTQRFRLFPIIGWHTCLFRDNQCWRRNNKMDGEYYMKMI